MPLPSPATPSPLKSAVQEPGWYLTALTAPRKAPPHCPAGDLSTLFCRCSSWRPTSSAAAPPPPWAAEVLDPEGQGLGGQAGPQPVAQLWAAPQVRVGRRPAAVPDQLRQGRRLQHRLRGIGPVGWGVEGGGCCAADGLRGTRWREAGTVMVQKKNPAARSCGVSLDIFDELPHKPNVHMAVSVTHVC